MEVNDRSIRTTGVSVFKELTKIGIDRSNIDIDIVPAAFL